MANIPVPYGSKLHIPPTNYQLLAAQQELTIWYVYARVWYVSGWCIPVSDSCL